MDVTLTYSVCGVVYDCVHMGTYVRYTYVEVKGQPQVVLTFFRKKEKETLTILICQVECFYLFSRYSYFLFCKFSACLLVLINVC